jgi:hypothetical protein
MDPIRLGGRFGDPVPAMRARASRSLVGVGQSVEVLLGSLALGVAHLVHHAFEVGAAGEKLGRMGVAEVVFWVRCGEHNHWPIKL